MRELIRRARAARWLPYLLLVGLAFAFTAVHAHEHEQFSPFDEYVYYDYLAKVPTEGFVHGGEEVGSDARNELSCRGVLNYGTFGEGCDIGTHERDSLYPYGGGTGADIYAPPYFVVTWVLAQPFTLFGSDLVDAARWVGGIWLAGGLSLTYALMRALRISSAAALGVSATLLGLPAVYWATQYISTDAPTLAVGAAIGLAALATARGRVGPWLLPLASVGAVLFKVQNLGAVVLAALAVLIWLVASAPRERRWSQLRRGPAVGAVLAVIAAVSAQVGWLVVRRLTAVDTPANVDTSMTPLTFASIVAESMKFLRSIGETGLPVGTWATLWAGLFGLAAIGGVVAAILDRQHAERWSVGISTAVTGLAFGPALALATAVLVGHYIPLPQRYGIVLLCAVALCVAWMFDRGTVSRRITAGVGVFVGVASVVLV